jgi:hypothetical protein
MTPGRIGGRAEVSLQVKVAVCALAFMGCMTGGDSSGSGSNPILQYPGACTCERVSGGVYYCVVTADYATCRSLDLNCNPFFYTNTDCSRWCPGSPQGCG